MLTWFTAVSFSCAEPSSDELRRLIMQHGGRYEQYLRKTVVTHIIATSLPDSKMRSLHDFKVVKPEWITDRYLFAEDFNAVKLDWIVDTTPMPK